jgi:FlaA1/EpsC-like NDP-sugar epimerase
VTHPDITRYFMTIPEAARLVVQAAVIGETGQVYVLDMGEPVRIFDLARSMIQMSGRGRDEIAIVTTGLRPGEKLFEELLVSAEATVPTRIARLRVARLGTASGVENLSAELDSLTVVGSGGEAVQARPLLLRWVPEFCSGERGGQKR